LPIRQGTHRACQEVLEGLATAYARALAGFVDQFAELVRACIEKLFFADIPGVNCSKEFALTA